MNECKVYNLLDPAQRKAAQEHVQRQINDTRRDLSLVDRADQALAEIEALLLEMRALAQSAAQQDADRALLDQAFAALLQRLDQAAAGCRDALSPQEIDRLETLMKSLGGNGIRP